MNRGLLNRVGGVQHPTFVLIFLVAAVPNHLAFAVTGVSSFSVVHFAVLGSQNLLCFFMIKLIFLLMSYTVDSIHTACYNQLDCFLLIVKQGRQ